MKTFILRQEEKSPKDRLAIKMKMLGAVQIIIGIACAVVGFCAIGIDRANIEFLKEGNKTVESYVILGLDSAPVVSSVWIIIAGLIPSCLICGSDYNLIKSKTIFMVFSIIAASVFVPLMILTSVAAFILRGSHEQLLVAVIISAGIEFVFALISACFCCMSPWAACKLEKERKKELREKYEDQMKKETDGEKKDKDSCKNPPPYCP